MAYFLIASMYIFISTYLLAGSPLIITPQLVHQFRLVEILFRILDDYIHRIIAGRSGKLVADDVPRQVVILLCLQLLFHCSGM